MTDERVKLVEPTEEMQEGFMDFMDDFAAAR